MLSLNSTLLNGELDFAEIFIFKFIENLINKACVFKLWRTILQWNVIASCFCALLSSFTLSTWFTISVGENAQTASLAKMFCQRVNGILAKSQACINAVRARRGSLLSFHTSSCMTINFSHVLVWEVDLEIFIQAVLKQKSYFARKNALKHADILVIPNGRTPV